MYRHGDGTARASLVHAGARSLWDPAAARARRVACRAFRGIVVGRGFAELHWLGSGGASDEAGSGR